MIELHNPVIKKGNKKAVSPLIAYIILIVVVVAMVPMVYTFLKSWVPESDPMKCPDEVSVFIQEVNIENGNLTIKIKNNGRFNIGGFQFYGANSTNQTVATIDLSENFYETSSTEKMESTSIITKTETKEENPFYTGQEFDFKFDISGITGGIKLVDITPIRYQVHENRIRNVLCGNAKIGKKIN